MFAMTGSGRTTLSISRVLLATVPRSGAADSAIAELSRNPRISRQIAQWDLDAVRSDLSEYGAWDAKELSDNTENVQRMLWILVCDAQEEATGLRAEHEICLPRPDRDAR